MADPFDEDFFDEDFFETAEVTDCIFDPEIFDNCVYDNCEDCVEQVGGPSGGRSTQKGRSVYDNDKSLGERPHAINSAESKGKLRIQSGGVSKGKLQIQVRALSESITKALKFSGYSYSPIQLRSRGEAKGRLKFRVSGESMGFTAILGLGEKLKKMEQFKRIMSILSLYNSVESFEPKIDTIRSFTFNETVNDEKLRAFTHSSSFVGNVRFDTENQSMRIILNGQAYEFCNVPERIYDSFEGADSKGAFFARNIKGQFNC